MIHACLPDLNLQEKKKKVGNMEGIGVIRQK